MTGAAGGIVGVSSKSKAPSIRIYSGRSHYNEWVFMYTQPTQTPGAGGGATTAPGQRGGQPGQPGTANPGGGQRGRGERGNNPQNPNAPNFPGGRQGNPGGFPFGNPGGAAPVQPFLPITPGGRGR